jgi:16S rRNA (adenine1518-N6/adenine1519-N6)-dimethyltransferase
MAGPPEREPFHRYRETLAALGFRPSRARGQNFLLDPSLHRWIADQAAPGAADTVVEIGTGLGFLTGELAARAGRVLAIEIDGRLLQLARALLGERPNVTWLEADVLGGDQRRRGQALVPAIGEAGAAAPGRFLVVANLPYSVSGPVLAELLQLDRLPDRIVVLVQKELGARLASRPGNRDYGGLSALAQAVCTVRALRDVSPEVFRPRPRVWSSVVQLDVRQDLAAALASGAGRRGFATFVRELFGHRRKVLRGMLARAAAAIGGTAPELADADAGRRAEQLTPDDLVELWQRCLPAGG